MLDLLKGPLSEYYLKFPVQASAVFFFVCALMSVAAWYLLMVYPSGRTGFSQPNADSDTSNTYKVEQQQNVNNSAGSTVIQAGRDVLYQATPKYTGVLEHEVKTLLNAKEHLYPKLELGDGGTIFRWTGEAGKPLLKLAENDSLTISVQDGEIKLSTLVRNDQGSVVAELLNNEWKIAPPPKSWDRNYSKSALEVKDDKGDIVLQVRLKEDRIQLQAVFYDGPESGLAIGSASDGAGGVMEVFRKGEHKRTLKIRPMFRYPSELHLGQLIG